MNPQPPEFIGHLFAAIIIAMFVFYFCKAFGDSSKHINLGKTDLFVLGRIEDSPPIIIKEPPTIIKEPVRSFKTLPIYKDCVDALHSIGMKKTEARKRTDEIFSNAIPSSIQDFLIIALNKK